MNVLEIMHDAAAKLPDDECAPLLEARLVVAELYEALQAMVADFGYAQMDDANLLYELNEGNEGVRCLIQARAALAKAAS